MTGSNANQDMIETYLEVVAAQLSKDQAEDITAELRDEILARVEDREASLGRGLNGEEIEALLREVGHPLVVASRYGSEPKGLIGPELYPWWIFAIRIGVIALLALGGLRFVADVLFADMHVGEAFGRAIGGFVRGLMTVLGCVTFAGWVIERQSVKPQFLSQWKVRDLGLFAWAAGLERSALDFLRGHINDAKQPKGAVADKGGQASAVAGAATSAVFTLIVLLWWVGALGGVNIGTVRLYNGIDISDAVREIHAQLYWPVAAIMAGRVVFDVMRVVTGSPVRLTAAGDLIFALANMALFVWLWAWSPLSDMIRVDTVSEFWQRLLWSEGWAVNTVPTLLMAVVVFGFIGELVRAVTAVASLVLDRRIGAKC